MKRSRVALSWSSGKDSAWTLHRLRQRPELEVVELITTMNTTFDRVAMHAVRRELLQQQALAVGLPLLEVPIPYPCSNADYERIMSRHIEDMMRQEISHIAFGDLFLEDIRRYRERQLQGSGITPLFPLWGEPTGALAHTMIAAGLKAIITCVDPKQIAGEYGGRFFDAGLIASLADGVDPCGENGEFHTFAFDGPMFQQPVDIVIGATVQRDGFVFTDLLPGSTGAPKR
ncbi:MAG: Dph6-related ATP pyrophosphatase [Sulfuricaulis sp.]